MNASMDQWLNGGNCAVCSRKPYCKTKCRENQKRLEKVRKAMAQMRAKNGFDENRRHGDAAKAAFREMCRIKGIEEGRTEELLDRCFQLSLRTIHPQLYYIRALVDVLHHGRNDLEEHMAVLEKQFCEEIAEHG